MENKIRLTQGSATIHITHSDLVRQLQEQGYITRSSYGQTVLVDEPMGEKGR